MAQAEADYDAGQVKPRRRFFIGITEFLEWYSENKQATLYLYKPL